MAWEHSLRKRLCTGRCDRTTSGRRTSRPRRACMARQLPRSPHPSCTGATKPAGTGRRNQRRRWRNRSRPLGHRCIRNRPGRQYRRIHRNAAGAVDPRARRCPGNPLPRTSDRRCHSGQRRIGNPFGRGSPQCLRMYSAMRTSGQRHHTGRSCKSIAGRRRFHRRRRCTRPSAAGNHCRLCTPLVCPVGRHPGNRRHRWLDRTRHSDHRRIRDLRGRLHR
jgi:hypothetical protein